MNGKKISLLLLLVMGFGKDCLADSSSSVNVASSNGRECGSHQFVPRSASTDLTWINALTYYNRTREYPDKKYFWNSATIYQSSKKSRELGAAFLLGDGNNVLTVEQGGGAGVVNSLELGLGNLPPADPFAATLEIRPSRKQFTYIGNMYVNLSDWWCGLWGDFTWGITNAHHRLNCCETGNLSTMCPGIQTISDALNDTPEFSKFYCGLCRDGKRRTGFEDVQLRLGYDYMWCDDNRIGIYAIGTIPAGRSPTDKYIFEPLVGSKHGSVGVGFLGDYQFNFCGCDDANLTLMTDFNYRYVFQHQECRTFDLLPNGPFSRYLLVVDASNFGAPFPAANVTTAHVKIKPRSTIQWWVGLNYEYCEWDFEVGYNLWWRQKEQFDQACVPLPNTVGVYNLNGCGLSQVTASNATMTNSGTADGAFIVLEPANLDINSGLAGRALTNKVYAALSWTGCACDCFEWMTGFGASYEFVSKHDRCNALQNWAVFGKWAVGF